jgi:hypothetical protein
MRRRAKIGGARRFPLVLALFGGALMAATISANAQVDRTSPRERPGFHGHTMGARPSRSPLATDDARPIDADRDGADHPAGEPETVSRRRHIQDCVESARNDPRWKEKKPLAEPHCAER